MAQSYGGWTFGQIGYGGGEGDVSPFFWQGPNGQISIKAPDAALKAAAKAGKIKDLMWMTGGDFTRVKQLGLLPGADWNSLGKQGAAWQAANTDSNITTQDLLKGGLAIAGGIGLGAGLSALGAGSEAALAGGELAGGSGADVLAGSAGSDALATGAGGEFTGGLASVSGSAPGLSVPGGFNTAALGAGGEAVTAPGLAGAAASGSALAPGYFAGETLYPVLGGATAAAGAGAGAAAGAAAAGGSVAERLLGGAATSADLLRLAGIAGATGLGVYGANQQSDALTAIANQSRADRAPFLNKSLQYLNDPGAYLSGPGKAALDATLRALSVKGNPIGNPAALELATSAGLRDWRDAVTGFGNLGLSGEDSRNSLLAGAAGADAAGLNAIGYGIGQATNPPNSLEQLLRQMGKGGSGYSLSL